MFVFKNVAMKFLCLLIALSCAACNDEDNGTTAIATAAASGRSTAQPLSITGQPVVTAEQSADYYFKAQAAGGNSATRVFSIQNKPAWANFDTSTGELTGTPQAGTYANVVVSVSDGITTTQLPAFSITVKGGNSVTISWVPPVVNTDGSSLNGLKGYVIHYGTNANALTERIEIASASTSSYKVTGLTVGTTYYFAVTAVNAMDMGGELSEVVSTTI